MTKTPTRRKRSMAKAANTEAATPRTIEEKLAAARKLVAKYEARINSLAQINNVQDGDDVSFSYGRQGKSGLGIRTLSGTVKTVADTDQGRMVLVEIGEGLDIELKKVRAADITENRTAASREPTEEAPASDEASDPLDNA